jgi:hypothetical protein
MLRRWHLGFHGRVAHLRDGKLSTQTPLVKSHRFGAVAIKKQEGHELHQDLSS